MFFENDVATNKFENVLIRMSIPIDSSRKNYVT